MGSEMGTEEFTKETLTTWLEKAHKGYGKKYTQNLLDFEISSWKELAGMTVELYREAKLPPAAAALLCGLAPQGMKKPFSRSPWGRKD